MKQNKEITVSVIGGINIDIIGKSIGPILMDNSNPGITEINIGGVACNIARTLSLLGKNSSACTIKVKMYSAAGGDAFSKMVLTGIKKYGIDTSGILNLKSYKTGRYLSILNTDSEMVTAISDMRIMEAINAKVIEKWEPEIAESDFLAADTNLTAESLDGICRIADKNKIPVLVDPVSVQKAIKILEVKHSITYCTPNEAEYLALSDEKQKDLEKGIISGFPGVKNIIITRGKRDVVFFDSISGESRSFPVKPVNVENPNGAGDAFAAGLIYALITGTSVWKAVEAGIASAKEALKTMQSIP